ncbi:MAG: acetyl-coenzyme A synthetase, partial [Chloroflexi bacterium]
MSESPVHAIETMQVEERRFPPPPGFAAQANAKADLYQKDFDSFWTEEGRRRVKWFKPFDKLLEWNLP